MGRRHLSTPLNPSSDAGSRASQDAPLLQRTRLADADGRKLFFAQVREDPELELMALDDALDGPIAIIGSAGCTALSLVAAGATDVVAVDANPVQNHLVELKAVAAAVLGPDAATRLLGGADQSGADRLATYRSLRPRLGPEARSHWDSHQRAIASGVLGAGATERFLRLIARLIRLGVHPASRIDRLLACQTLDEQQAFYRDEWDTRRWRALFRLLLNERVFSRVYDPAFFAQIGTKRFADYFLDTVGRTVTESPVADNYFLHHILTGRYPDDSVAGGRPPYLDAARAENMTQVAEAFRIIDGTLGSYLQSCPRSTFAGFSLSNICEWLTPDAIEAMFGEIVRTARPGARVCFRNFVGWTEVPERWRDVVKVDEALSDKLSRRDRSLMQRRIVVADIEKG